MDTKLELLKRYFGYSAFRDGQEELIDAQLAGRDAFGIMPTGGGKSLCYQIPALMLPGITLVISPLISLMQDQVLALKSAGVPAASGVLFLGERVLLTMDEGELQAKFPQSGTVEADPKLLVALKALRSRLAKQERVPAYVVFSNKTLEDMAAKRPKTMTQLLSVSGVGEVKAKRYGKAFLEELTKFDG